nr:orotidine-5'-phosphate decarboxylase [Streptomyces spiramenti]
MRAATAARGPLCVGVDPHAGLLREWGLGEDIGGLERFCGTVTEALADKVAVVKPQSAFFERFGSRGIAVLERTVADFRAAGALVLLDVKRGDIGSTMGAYADAYLDPAAPLFSDAVTLSPYLGFEALRPALDLARASGSGVFVLARTSNPEGGPLQRARCADGRGVAADVLARLARENAATAAGSPFGSFGAVVGATLAGVPGGVGAHEGDGGDGGLTHADLDIGGPLLLPGLGAQGARPEDLPALLGPALPAALPSVSRDVLRHGPDRGALRSATDRWIGELAAVIG